jgi:hypothetical protein
VKVISDTLRYSFIIQTLGSPPRWRRHSAKIAIGQVVARTDEVIE